MILSTDTACYGGQMGAAVSASLHELHICNVGIHAP